MSFVLTTRIWFNISIENISIKGLFVMSQNNTLQEDFIFDNENLLKPSKMVVHTGQDHMLIFNNTRDREYYSFILNGSKDAIRDWLTNYESYNLSRLPKTELQEIRKERAIELIFEYHIELENIKSLLNIEKNPWSDITNISSIIVSPIENKIYIVDKKKESIYEFASTQKSSILAGVITEIEKRNDFTYVFLNEYNKENFEDYSDFAIVPVSIATMPMLSVKNEIILGNKINPEVAKFFNDDSSNISSMKDLDGKVTYSDREEETITIDAEGALEYYKYNISPDNAKHIGVKEAIEVATQYVNNHLGYTYDFYLSNIEKLNLGGRTSYIISFDYKYNGIPIITQLDTGNSAIEVEIMGKEVKRYKRNVRVIEDQGQTTKIMNSIEILNIVWGDLDNYLNATKSESIVVLNDLYLAYFERNAALIPVWVVDVIVEDKANKQYVKKYVIGAEEGVILEEK
jgi:hypothetical protein